MDGDKVDGSKEGKQVQVDAANQRLIVGDDVKTYQNGNQLIVSPLDDVRFKLCKTSKLNNNL